jgi:hypothetical protein
LEYDDCYALIVILHRTEDIDEAPFAYKPMGEIVASIADTADVLATIKPLYNFKAAE